MKVINMFAGPGSGKSTLAAHVFALMKWKEYKVEHIQEYIKSAVYENRNIFSDQIYIFGKQQRRQHILRHQVDYVVTDSPLLLSAVYAPEDYFPSFATLCLEVHYSYDNINIFVERTKPYVNLGRSQTYDEAKEIDDKVQDFLVAQHIPYIVLPGERDSAQEIIDLIEQET